MFKTAKEFEKYLQSLIDRHYNDLSIILKKLGVYEAPTPQVLLSTFLTYGQTFSKYLALLPEENATSTGWEKFQDLFTKGTAIVTAGAGAYQAINSALNPNQVSQPGYVATGIPSPEQPTPAPETSTTKIVVIGAIVVVVLIVVFIVIKKFNK